MKYLETYKIFESSDIDIESMKKDIEDIFQEAKDIGYETKIDFEKHDFDAAVMYRFKFRIVRKDPHKIDDTIDFYVNDIREDVLRMIDYMNSVLQNPVYSIYLFTMPSPWKNWQDFSNNTDDKEIYILRVEGWIHTK